MRSTCPFPSRATARFSYERLSTPPAVSTSNSKRSRIGYLFCSSAPRRCGTILFGATVLLALLALIDYGGESRRDYDGLPHAPVSSHVESPGFKHTTLCENEVTNGLARERLLEAVRAREAWGREDFQWSASEIAPRNRYMSGVNFTDAEMLDSPSFAKRVWGGGLRPVKQHLGVTSLWERLNALGPSVFRCKDMRVLAKGDEEKKICWHESMESEECVVYSIGSNNQWEFELDVSRRTKCRIHTFDCTVRRPTPPKEIEDRVVFHKLCIGSEESALRGHQTQVFTNFVGLVRAAGAKPTFIKMDIEGYEWTALSQIMSVSREHKDRTGEDLLPAQIAVEFHYYWLPWSYLTLAKSAILAFSNRLLYTGGYLIVDKRDNLYGYAAAEFLLARVVCN